ncbi:MAG: hypothetical protein II779_00725 [Clostridia bacterium]|nr:hypothetical protein [Clostridia bacterium]
METEEMEKLTGDYERDIAALDAVLRPGENYDIIKRTIRAGNAKLTLYYLGA